MVSASVSFGGGNPADSAETQTRNSSEISIDRAWAAGNPALVGLESRHQTRLSLFPTSIALWNDKVSLPLSNMTSIKSWVTELMRESFGIREGLSPDEASNKLTRELSDGIYFYAGSRTAPVDFATRSFGLSVRTFADADLKLPSGLFMPFFSADKGLLAGSTLDLSATRVRELWATEISAKYGLAIEIPFISDYLRLDNGAAGAGVKALIGHNYFSVEANKECKIYYDPESNKYNSGMTLDVLSAEGGYGWGFDLGAVFHNDNHAVSIDVQDIGMIQWPGQKARRGKITVGELDLNGGGSDFFDVGKLTPGGKDAVIWLPTALNVGYLYYLDLSSFYGNGLGALLNYLSASFAYNQPLALGVGVNTYAPRVSAGAKLGFLGGYLPIRYGLIFGGPEELASTAGIELGKRGSFAISYKAVGSPILLPQKGFEVAFSQTTVWGGKGKAKDKRRTTTTVLPPIQPPIDTASAASAPPEVKETAVDTASAVKKAAVDTTTAPHTVPATDVDTTAATHNAPEKAVDTTAATHTAPATVVDTTAAPHNVPEKAVDTTAVHHNVPEKTVDTTAVHHNVPAKTVDTTAAPHIVPEKTVDTTTAPHNVPAKSVDTTAAPHNVPAKAVDTTTAPHNVPVKAVDTTAVHHNIPTKTVDTTAVHHNIPAKATVDTATVHHNAPAKASDTTAAAAPPVPEVKKSSDENKPKGAAPTSAVKKAPVENKPKETAP